MKLSEDNKDYISNQLRQLGAHEIHYNSFSEDGEYHFADNGVFYAVGTDLDNDTMEFRKRVVNEMKKELGLKNTMKTEELQEFNSSKPDIELYFFGFPD